jgi:hypothetical protein
MGNWSDCKKEIRVKNQMPVRVDMTWRPLGTGGGASLPDYKGSMFWSSPLTHKSSDFFRHGIPYLSSLALRSASV